MAFPPLVSSTPPPLEEFEEEEDEFGDFASGGMDGLSLSSGSPHKLPTPLKTPIGTPVHVVPEEVDKTDVEVQVKEEVPVRMDRIHVEDAKEVSEKDQDWKDSHVEATEVFEEDRRGKESDGENEDIFVEAKDQYIDLYTMDGLEHRETKNLFVEDRESNKLDVEDRNEYLEPKEQYSQQSGLYGEDIEQFREPIDLHKGDPEPPDLYNEYNDEYKESKDLYEEYQQEFKESNDFFEECQQEFAEPKDFYEEYKPEHKEPKDFYEEFKPEYKESEDLYEEHKEEYKQSVVYDQPIENSSIIEVNKENSSPPAVQSARIRLDDVGEDEFGDFEDFEDFQASFPPVEQQPVWTAPETTSQEEFHCPEDFGDFESNVDLLGSIKRIENENASNKIEDILRTMFPQSPPAADDLEINVGSLIGNSDKLWVRIKNVEESHALNFHWSNSNSNNVLLEALGIDSRNILFGPRWNPNVPRFAANLGFAPLEPTKAPEKPVFEPEKSTEEVPAAQFDWNSSGLVNPLEANVEEREEKRKKQEARRRETASRRKAGKENSGTVLDRHGRQMAVQPETVKVLRKLPDLTFLSARSLMLDRSMLESQLAG